MLVREGERWALSATVETVSLPPTLHGLLLSRVDRLPAATRRVLQAAAVLGMSFDEALLQAVAGEVRPALQHLLEADLVRDAGPGQDGPRYRFTHALLHDVVYENQLMSRRSELHERAGQALELAVGPVPSRVSDLEALGHHWSFTADKARGARYLTVARCTPTATPSATTNGRSPRSPAAWSATTRSAPCASGWAICGC